MILTLLVIITSTSISAAIIDYAAHNTVNVIVIGLRGRSGIKKVLLVRDSRCDSRCEDKGKIWKGSSNQ
jgi:hypothetical protein